MASWRAAVDQQLCIIGSTIESIIDSIMESGGATDSAIDHHTEPYANRMKYDKTPGPSLIHPSERLNRA